MTSTGPLADAPPRLMDGAAMDYFLIETVAALRASAGVAVARAREIEREMVDAGLVPPPPPPAPLLKKERERERERERESAGSTLASAVTAGKAPLDEDEEEVRVRLESIGAHVGANLAERLCRDRGLFADTLDSVKFICKDVWIACWDKQVDNLRTNHRGVYVLQDNAFKPISRLSSWEGRPDALRRARLYVALPAGIIRGALTRMGFANVTVTPEINSMPSCTFQVKLPKGT
ncbi:TRAPP complex subunit trs33 [Punctularia strigosozonata HHB-11173 SS5]|uniref:TRAPP complex subunit trs33 n=1 Tax=Punctularia strigosozonata (strain HHB-11173) TaxID=741275 RepID=UPI00044167F5|nr:TRAPP complex subunit trs33 [Punctularia strigosozonata HHB-11173 SS5]EIN13142.1 TRAPP complex subunit trs33 [Punctularia strigosozonata HHB-11173 SS5]